MLSAVITNRGLRAGAGLIATAALVAGCSSTTNGRGAAEVPTARGSSTTPDFPIAPATSKSPVETTAPAASTSTTSTIHPAPPTPVRTVTVDTHQGAVYVVKIWWDVKDDTCFDHAYGSIVTWL